MTLAGKMSGRHLFENMVKYNISEHAEGGRPAKALEAPWATTRPSGWRGPELRHLWYTPRAPDS